ncbi:MAG: hypothetical protein JWP87_1019 [Labilithrix sp.]|nr:hypothetical protein [Labilithrix sp.]
MSDDKPKPVDDLKQGLNLLFRAAKGAIEKLPTDKVEGAVKDGAKEVGKAFETVANEIDKAFTNVTHRATGSSPPARQAAPGENPHPPEPTTAEGIAQAKDQHDADEAKKKDAPGAPQYDDAYAPEPREPGKGPRIG